jgi:predicted TIM-barrel fold metal-dependent hydrolase
MSSLSRRQVVVGTIAAAVSKAAVSPVIETHVHLFDPERVPYAPNAPYKPPAYTVEEHVKFARAAGLAHSVIVHPEPYQDDHSYLEYCFAHEPSPGYFKGTCLFDPFREDTPERLAALVTRWPKRIVAMRIHEMSMTAETGATIRNRDMKDARMAACWGAISGLGLGVQMHFIPGQAPAIRALAAKFPDTLVILDHMGRPGQGTEAEYREVLKLAELPRVIMKFSNWPEYKGDLPQLTRRIYEAFGPGRMVWGMLGNTEPQYRKQAALLDQLLAFAPEAERARIRGGNAQRLFYT